MSAGPEITTEALLAELRASKTDLALLVDRVARRRPPCVVVTRRAVSAWEGREPLIWAKVSAWLAAHGVSVVQI